MIVLKKFGFFLFAAILSSGFSIAQNNNTVSEKETKNISAADFIQQQLQLQQTQKGTNPLLKSTATSTIIPKGQLSDDLSNRLIKKESKFELKEDLVPSTASSSNKFGGGMMDWVKDKYSSMLNVLPNQISNVMLYRFIDEWYGTKYRFGGTSKSGIDCSAFVQNLYQYVFGLNILRTAWMQFESSKYISNISDLKEGDLVFFKIKSSRITHVGVYLKNNFFVHSASSKGVSIADITSTYWSKYFAGGGRIKE